MSDKQQSAPLSAGGVTGLTRRRLRPQPGEWIDRGRPFRFRFEGCTYYGFAGDTISSALAANGVRLLGRSFKYHRPRGIYSLANHDVNVLVSDGTHTNLRADVTPLWEGAELTAVNTFGGLANDLARHADKAGRFLPVGFYYKTFHKPRNLFAFWERRMRQMAGLGAIDPGASRVRTAKQYDWCDLLVIGAGPSGLAAALAAAEQGLSVTLVDEQPHLGGSLLYQGGAANGSGTLHSLLERLRGSSNLRLLTSTLAAGYYADHWVALVDDHRLTKMRAKSVVLATGVFEQPALFHNNDLPGVMLASAAQRLIRQYAVKPFDRPVVLAANADGYRAALDMHRVGIDVRMIVDLRAQGEQTELAAEAVKAGIAIRRGHVVYEASRGSDAIGVDAVVICPLDDDGHPVVKQGQRIECDGLAMSVGWAPADSLWCQARGKMRYSRELEQFVPVASAGGPDATAAAPPPGIFAAGRLNGVFDLEARLADGRRAGLAAAGHITGRNIESISPQRGTTEKVTTEKVSDTFLSFLSRSHPYPVVDHPAGKVFVDLDEDVQLKDIKHAVQEGFDGVELLKRYSTFGMGPSQGKIANTNTLRVLARLRGEAMGETGSPTARPFFHPVPLGHLAGRGLHPHRETALHSRHVAAGAQFVPAGEWRRPAYYKKGQVHFSSHLAQGAASPTEPWTGPTLDRERAIQAEVEAVRERIGVIDVSTLGKLEVIGPDAAEFIERIYTGRFAKMKPGTTRYGLMCDESGVIIDDGVIGRLADDRFYVTTTTTAAASVYREMQRWALVWKLDVLLANITGAFAAMNLAGPQSRTILAELSDVDPSESSFPYLALREGKVLDIACRILRTGFVGEIGYEIHVPAQWAGRLWDGILLAGASQGIRPFGVEAQRVLRLEKGHVIVSQDTDGLTTPYEAGMDWAVKDDKPFFIGGRSLRMIARKPLKRQLVGFTLPRDDAGPMPSECHLVIDRGEIVGRVTSIVRSPTLGRPIGLAYVRPSQALPGTPFQIRGDGGRMIEATVVELPFYDPTNARQREQRVASPASAGQPSSVEFEALGHPGGTRRQALGAGLTTRTSPIHEQLQQLTPTWSSIGGMPVAKTIGDAAHQRAVCERLGLADLSALARLTLKGPKAAEFFSREGMAVPDRIYECRKLADGGIVVRTGRTELFIEDSSPGGTVEHLRRSFTPSMSGVLPVWRQDVSLAISGTEALRLLPQVCSFNFANAHASAVMTQVAGVAAMVLRRQWEVSPGYQIWADGTYGPYLWDILLGIARELGGDAIGTACVTGA